MNFLGELLGLAGGVGSGDFGSAKDGCRDRDKDGARSGGLVDAILGVLLAQLRRAAGMQHGRGGVAGHEGHGVLVQAAFNLLDGGHDTGQVGGHLLDVGIVRIYLDVVLDGAGVVGLGRLLLRPHDVVHADLVGEQRCAVVSGLILEAAASSSTTCAGGSGSLGFLGRLILWGMISRVRGSVEVKVLTSTAASSSPGLASVSGGASISPSAVCGLSGLSADASLMLASPGVSDCSDSAGSPDEGGASTELTRDPSSLSCCK